MELRELQAFVKVVQTGSFTKAAEALSLTQPAITRQVASLESEFGIKLLDRLGRRAEATGAGIALYDYAARILALVDESRRAVADIGGGLSGELSIGASSTTATYLLPSVLKSFTKRFPNISISMSTGPTGRVTELVAAGKVDIGIVMDNRNLQGTTSIALAPYQLVVIVHPSHRLAARKGAVDVAKLAEEPLIVMQSGTTLRSSVEAIFESIGSPLRTLMELDNVESIKKMVEAELGISIVPEISAVSETETGSLVSLALQGVSAATQSIWAVHDSARYQSAASKKFIQLLQKHLADIEVEANDRPA